jgi:asparagine synthase (glutamine-hydrolysing)
VTRRSALLLSGGVDSTAFAATAAALRRSDSLESELLTYSFAFAELTACDERDVSDQVVQALGLPNEAIPADDAWPLARGTADGTQIDGPCRFRSHVLVARCLPLVHRAGATALIMGQRGDALVGGDAVDWVDRIRRGELAYVWSRMSLHARHSRQSRLALAHRHVIRPLAASVWPTRVAASLRRRLWSRVDGSRPVVPVWMDRRAVRSFGLHELADELTPQSELRDEAGRARDRRMRDPHHERNAEAIELQYALHGIRYVDPWADRRLIATLLACPADLAYRAGEPKWLLRQALAGLIPEAARVGLRKRTLQPLYERGLVDRSRPEVLRLIDGSRAAARGYVDARVLHTAYDGFVDRPRRVTGREWSFLWRFIELESWLRRLDVR